MAFNLAYNDKRDGGVQSKTSRDARMPKTSILPCVMGRQGMPGNGAYTETPSTSLWLIAIVTLGRGQRQRFGGRPALTSSIARPSLPAIPTPCAT